MDTYGLIGHPLGHSFSARFFTEKFQREGIDAQYLNFDLPDAALLTEVVSRHPDLRGLNVTIPHKRAVMPLLDDLSAEARAIGAVNVIRVEQRPGQAPRLTGHNADVVGFERSLQPLLRPEHRRALVLGTGGASLAVVYGLRRLGVEPQYVSRTARPGVMTYADVTPDVLAAHLVVVNCTPVGMSPHTDELPPLPYEALTSRHLLYDLIYNPAETQFLSRGRQAGAATKNGLEMLHLQALASWDIWQGRPVRTHY